MEEIIKLLSILSTFLNTLAANIKKSRRNALVTCLPSEPSDGAFLLLIEQAVRAAVAGAGFNLKEYL